MNIDTAIGIWNLNMEGQLIKWENHYMDFLTLAHDIHIFEKEPEKGADITFLSRIEAIGERSIFISPPFKIDCYWQILQAEVGKIISVRVVTERCSYIFEAELLGTSSASSVLWELSLPTNFKRIQRRQYVRLAIILEVSIKFINLEMNSITTFTKDISAGGLQVVLEEPPPENADVRILLPLNSEVTVEAQGEIIRVTFLETLRKRLAVAIKFNDIACEKQEQIIQYIFHKQVERRKKEKELFGDS